LFSVFSTTPIIAHLTTLSHHTLFIIHHASALFFIVTSPGNLLTLCHVKVNSYIIIIILPPQSA